MLFGLSASPLAAYLIVGEKINSKMGGGGSPPSYATYPIVKVIVFIILKC